ncbi:hypothetical protein M8818_001365 [Zalaria obscura]|uniref:Uncharacterized protein n=1 Tax=Zalaria obscura TaxID=2024903 RepID=A0ACC3SQ16_9PEZI
MEALQSYLGLGIREDFATRNIWMHNPLKILDPHCLSFDPSRPAPHPFNHDVVFVCIDIEAFEFDANKITEIGIATLDTRELVGISSGPRAERWIDKITYRHLRVQEHLHLVNERFVKACPERFLFGESEFMDLPHIVTTLNHLFDQTSGIGGEPGAESEHQKRNLVFVGHSLKNDFAFLKTIGVSLDANVRATQDTERLAGGTKRKGVGLERLLKALDVDALYLHNAGNDAAYTLQAMLRLAVLWAQGEMKTFQATLWSLPSSNSRKRERWEKLKRGATDQNALGAVREGSQLEQGARNKAVEEEAVEEGETRKTVVRRVAGSKALPNVLERQLREDAGKQLGETTKKRRWAGLGNESPERTGKPAMGGPRRRIGEEVREGFGGDLTAEIGARTKEERYRAIQARIQEGRQNMNSERK